MTQAGLVINWCKQSQIKPLLIDEKPAIELELISEEYKLTGHPDLVATFGDDPMIWIIDWKTSKEARRTYILQMAAYAKMLKEQYNLEANVGAILRVPSDPNAEKQFETHTVYNLQTKWWPKFEAALDLYTFFKKKGEYKEVWGIQ